MVETEINGIKFRTGKMGTFDQFHVMRRLMPLMSGLGQAFAQMPRPQLTNGEAGDEAETSPEATPDQELDVWKALEPVADALSSMPDSDCEYVLKKCLSAVQLRNDQGAWRPVFTQGQFMFEDRIDLPTMMQLTVLVIQDNLANFFPVGQQQDTAEGSQ
jgi:hypothetical protein